MVAAPETVSAASATNGAPAPESALSPGKPSTPVIIGHQASPHVKPGQLANGHSEHANDEHKPKDAANLPPPEIARQIPCRFFPLGTCKYGENCAFSHSLIPSMSAPYPGLTPSAVPMPIPGQQPRGGADFSQSMQHPGMMMYYPQSYEHMPEYGYPNQFSPPPQGFYYPPQFPPYYAPPQPFYPPANQSTSPGPSIATSPDASMTMPSSAAPVPASATAEPAPVTAAETTTEDARPSGSVSESMPTTASATTTITASTAESSAETARSAEAPSNAVAPNEIAQPVAGPSDLTASTSGLPIPVTAPAFFQPAPMMQANGPFYNGGRTGGRTGGGSMRHMNGATSNVTTKKRFVGPDGTRLPRPACSFFEANRCRNRDACPFPHVLPDGSDARKLGKGMLGIDGRTENPEKEGGMPPSWQAKQRQSGPRSGFTKEGRPVRQPRYDADGQPIATASGSSSQQAQQQPYGNDRRQSHSSSDPRVSLGRLPPGSSAPSLVAAINGLTRRIPPMSNQQGAPADRQHHSQQRVPSGEDFPALTGTGAVNTPAHERSRESTHAPASPEVTAVPESIPVREPWSPEVGRDGAPSTEPSPPQPSEKKASSDSGDSDFIIVTANDADTSKESTARSEAEAGDTAQSSPTPAGRDSAQPRISFASAAAKAASKPGPAAARSAASTSKTSRPPPAAVTGKTSSSATTTATTSPTVSSATVSTIATSATASSGANNKPTHAHGKNATPSSPAAATMPAVAQTQQQTSEEDVDDEGFTVAVSTRRERRDNRRNANGSGGTKA